MTQKQNVLAHLKAGKTITPIQALESYGCFRLADVVFKLRKDGHRIKTEEYQTPNGAIVGRYRLQ